MTDINDEKTNPDIPDISAVIEKLKSNPEIVTSIASVLGANISESAQTQEGSRIDIPPQLPEMISTMAPLFSLSGKEHGGRSPESDHRVALLCALKPYLNHERQEIVDYILKFSKIGDLLKKLK